MLNPDPIAAFEEWYATIAQQHQLNIAIRLIHAVPQLDAAQSNAEEDLPVFFLRQPIAHPEELVGRIGILKVIVDVYVCAVPLNARLDADRDASLAVVAMRSNDPLDRESCLVPADRGGASPVDERFP